MQKVSILTPSWNRSNLLKELYCSLLKQTSKNFEWIIVDDCSDDNTQMVVENFLNSSPFRITYARFSKRVGKIRADNTLMNLMNSNFMIWCDSDDTLLPHSIERLSTAWESIPPNEAKNFIGIVSLCADKNGAIQSSGPSDFHPFVARWIDLGEKFNMTGDMCIMQSAEVVNGARFPEHDLVMSESGFWKQFMHLKVLCIPDVLKIMTRDTPNRISGSKKMEYCRGKAYSIIYADSESFTQKCLWNQFKLAAMYHRYCIHGDIGISERADLFRGKKSATYVLGAILGYLQAAKDLAQGNVVKTHKVFEQGRDATYVLQRNFA